VDIKKILIYSGHKLTRPRLTVLGGLRKESRPVSASDLHKKINSVD